MTIAKISLYRSNEDPARSLRFVDEPV
ncbi:hypothetical protein ACULV4_002941 [Cronobacter dublinensis]